MQHFKKQGIWEIIDFYFIEPVLFVFWSFIFLLADLVFENGEYSLIDNWRWYFKTVRKCNHEMEDYTCPNIYGQKVYRCKKCDWPLKII